MSKLFPTTDQQIAIKYNQIFVPGGANIRKDLPATKALAASMKSEGQLTPVVVTNGGSSDQPYTLVAGFRRMAAYALNGWEDREILAVVRVYAKGDVLSRISDNWIENMQRESLSPLDQAECMYQLLSGTYHVADGEVATPIDKKEICSRFQMSPNHLGALVKVFRSINSDVKINARKNDAPLRLLIAMSRIEGKNEEDIANKQHLMLTEWIAGQEALKAEGRKRATRSDKKKGRKEKDGAGFSGFIKPTKRLDERGTAADYLTVLRFKSEAKETPKEDRVKAAGMIEVMRYLTGDLKKFPLLTNADFAVLAPEEEEEEEAEEEVEEAGEEGEAGE